MAIHHQLPIYKVAYNLADLTIDLIKNMPREVKAVIGSELRDECLRLLVLIFRANVATDKRAHLTQLIERQQVVELLLTGSLLHTLCGRFHSAPRVSSMAQCGAR